MNVDTGQVLTKEQIEALYGKGAQDWEDLPEGATAEQIAGLQRPMNRHERRAAIARLRKEMMPMENEFLIQFFKYDHLPEHLQTVSKPFGDLADSLVETLPRNPERTVALRKLLEAKDCAVRAQLAK